MSEDYILAHDVGTGSDKAAILDTRANLIDHQTSEYEVSHPEKGCALQDPEECWWEAIIETTGGLLEVNEVEPSEIEGIVFSAQMSGTLPVDEDGSPLLPCMIWLDTRASVQAEEMLSGAIEIGGYDVFTLAEFVWITGGAPGLAGKDPISKILWIRENEPEVYEQTHKFLNVKDFLIHKSTGNFVTSEDDANLTWLMDIRTKEWSDVLCEKYGVNMDKLPKIKESPEIAGELTPKAANDLGLETGTSVVVGSGDVTSAAVGSGSVGEKETHGYIGTSSWLGSHTSDRRGDLSHYIGSICSANPQKYLCIAEQENAGGCLEWIKNQMYKREMIRYEEKVEEIYQLFDRIVEDVEPGSKDLIFTPWIYGERAPLDDHSVRGGFHNLSLDHSREHLLRAVFEGVAFNLKWALKYQEDLIGKVEGINFVGGGASSDVWCQIFADVLNRRINKVQNPREAGVRGAAMIAAVGLGHIEKFEDVKELVEIEKSFTPNSENREIYDGLFEEFKEIYWNNKEMYERLNEIP